MRKVITLLIIALSLPGMRIYSQTCSVIADYSYQADSIITNRLSFTNLTTGVDTTATAYWDFGDGSSSNLWNTIHSYGDSGTYHVCLTVHKDSLCNRTTCKYITIIVTPCNLHSDYSWQADSLVPNKIIFTNISAGAAVNATAYWQFGDGTSSQAWDSSHIFPGAGVYHVCLMIYNNYGCSDVICKDILVGGPCNVLASFSLIPDSSGVHTYFYNTSSGIMPNSTALWNFGDGNTSTEWSPSHIYTQAGTYHVCLTVYNDSLCSNTSCRDTTINSVSCSLIVNYSEYADSLNYNKIYFNNQSTGTVAGATAYWDFGDGTTSTLWSPNHIYTQMGIYTVCLTVYNDSLCTNTTCQNVTIASPPCNLIANYSEQADSLNYNKIYFNNQSTGWIAGATAYWEFGDGNSSTLWSPNHIYTQEGTYTVCLTVYNDTICNNSTCQDITVVPPICNLVANYSEYADSVTYNKIYFNNQSTGIVSNVTAYWDFGDGNSSTLWSPNHIYTPGAIYYACLTVQNDSSCTQTTCQYITVNSSSCNIASNFSYQADTTITNSISFTNLSTGADTTATAYWDFGDGSSSASWNTNHYYTDSGTYHVCLTVSNDSLCSSTTCHDITVVVTPCNLVTDFSWNVDPLVSNRLIFTNISTGTSLNANAYWNFGDGTTSVAWDSSHVFPGAGVYHVCLNVYNNSYCYQSICKDITIGGPCNLVANFSSFTDSALNTLMYFSNQSSGTIPSTTTLWDFGDGTTSTAWNSSHTYAQSGYYNVCLTVSNGASCSNTTCNNISLNIRAGGNIVIYPNPASSQININVPLDKSEIIYAYVYNSMGFLVQQLNLQGLAGSNNFVVNIGSFSAGVYRVRIVHGSQTYTTSFIKL